MRIHVKSNLFQGEGGAEKGEEAIFITLQHMKYSLHVLYFPYSWTLSDPKGHFLD